MANDGRTGNEASRDAKYRPSPVKGKGKSPKGNASTSSVGPPQIASQNREYMAARPLMKRRSGGGGD
jgi:hypothetical protein